MARRLPTRTSGSGPPALHERGSRSPLDSPLRRAARALFVLGALLAWLGALPWLLFALRLGRAVQPFYGALGYRSWVHPLLELAWLACCGTGLLVLLATRPPGAGAPWIALGVLLALAGAVLAAFGAADDRLATGRDLLLQGAPGAAALGLALGLRGDPPRSRLLHALGCALFAASFLIGARHLSLALRAVVCGLLARPLRRELKGPREALAHLALWLLTLGNAWAALAPGVRRAGLHVVFIGGFGALLLSALAPRPSRTLAAAAGLLAVSMLARALVELDPPGFHLWMGVASGAFLIATPLCALLALRLQPQGAAT